MKALNGWKGLWVSAAIIYLGIVLVGAYMKQPTKDDIRIADVLAFISTSTLKLMQATGKDAVWRETVEDGITISVPAQLDASVSKAYTTEYLAAHETALRERRVGFIAVVFACWALPSLLLLAVGFLAAWVRRGFSARAP